MVITPTQDNIIIQLPVQEKETVTKSGILLTSASQQEVPEKGTVVSVGTGRMLNDGKLIKPCVSIGDKVIFSRFAGTKVTVDSQEFLIVKENDILAIIK